MVVQEPSTAPLPPGTEKPRRLRPRLRYELISCGLGGHELIGTEDAELLPEHAIVARDDPSGLRWHRCLRCDSWLPLPPPRRPLHDHPPPRDAIDLPLRGRALRDKFVERLFAVDKLVHFVVLGLLAAAIFIFAIHRGTVEHKVFRVLTDIQGSTGGPTNAPHAHGFAYDIRRILSLKQSTLYGVGAAAAVYGLLEGLEGVGLWLQRRWAEYLAFVATGVFIPLEIYELTAKVSPFKVTALIVNVALVLYLLLRKRLFGVRGGRAAFEAERRVDVGWVALERATPPLLRGVGA